MYSMAQYVCIYSGSWNIIKKNHWQCGDLNLCRRFQSTAMLSTIDHPLFPKESGKESRCAKFAKSQSKRSKKPERLHAPKAFGKQTLRDQISTRP